MAAVVDNRFGTAVNRQPGMVSQPGVLVADQYGGWMTRKSRFVVFGIVGMAIVLGLFLPGLILIGRDFNGSRASCSDNIVVRALTTCCVFIFHALLVIPMFIAGDRAHAVLNNQNGLASFWRNRVAHTATVLQVVGNLIEIALLIWTAVGFWRDTNSGHTDFGNGTCNNNYSTLNHYMWALLIGGFAAATISLLTIRQQYTSAALRDSASGAYAQGGYGQKAGTSLQTAP
jgi:hypothetical protein